VSFIDVVGVIFFKLGRVGQACIRTVQNYYQLLNTFLFEIHFYSIVKVKNQVDCTSSAMGTQWRWGGRNGTNATAL